MNLRQFAVFILLVSLVAALGTSVAYGSVVPPPRLALNKNFADTDVPCDTSALIAAINAANSSAGADTINLAAGCAYTLTAVDNIIAGAPNGLPAITSEIVINGNGATIERSDAAGTPQFRILHVASTGDLTLNWLTVRNGDSEGHDAGGIDNDGGTVTLSDSTVSGNRASAAGGIKTDGGIVTLINSTVSGNIAEDGGGIGNWGTVHLINSTVSDNQAGIGGGIFTDGPTTLTGSTVSGNQAGYGGGIYIGWDSSLTLINTIVGDQFAGEDCAGETVISLGHNLDSDGTCGLTGPGDIVNADPLLGPLQDNGGPTETHALLPGSPAIDAGDDGTCLSTDQRGEPRPADGDGDGTATCDIGAYELQPTIPMAVPVDIRPQSCPNPLNVKEKGKLPVAILGTGDLDVTEVDPASVRLEGVAPLRWSLEDVATPYEPFIGKEGAHDCTEDGPDGYDDLTFKFSAQEIVAALGDVSDGDELVLQLTGNLKEEFGGTPIVGEDVVVILKK